MVHIYVNKNVCLSGHLDNLIDLAEELDILREPNDIEPNEAGGIEPALLHSASVLVAAMVGDNSLSLMQKDGSSCGGWSGRKA
jgi:hypothetical protein